MPESDLALLHAAARAAGKIALSFFKQSPETWEKADDAGPVTAADLAVDAMLRERLMAARPGYAWLSEETEDDPARLGAERCFIVDPIDGTRAFIAGQPAWSHSLAVAENGRVTAAVVYLPVNDHLYEAEAGGGARLDGSAIRVSDGTGALPTLLSGSASFRGERWKGGKAPFERHFRPSLAWRLALVGEGRFDGMLTLDPAWEWDVAAGALIAAEAGARVTDRKGAPLGFNSAGRLTEGVIAAAPGLHERILGALS